MSTRDFILLVIAIVLGVGIAAAIGYKIASAQLQSQLQSTNPLLSLLMGRSSATS